jgi:hypothetical protein
VYNLAIEKWSSHKQHNNRHLYPFLSQMVSFYWAVFYWSEKYSNLFIYFLVYHCHSMFGTLLANIMMNWSCWDVGVFWLLEQTALTMSAFWDVALCNLVEIYWHCRCVYCLHDQGRCDKVVIFILIAVRTWNLTWTALEYQTLWLSG